MKDNQLLSTEEKRAEREHEAHERDLARDSRSRTGRPSAARVTARVKGMARTKGVKIGTNKKVGKTGLRENAAFARAATPKTAPLREFSRRAVAKTSWAVSKKIGQWGAHAKYLEREGAQQGGQDGVGFSASSDAVNMSATARDWQNDGDSRVYKIILSPEDGIKLNMVEYTRKVMAGVQEQTGKPLEWMAIDHHNTGHDHVHILLRGRGLELSPELVKSGIRTIAENVATQTLGYKSQKEKTAELDNDISARRFTQLDRLIKAKVIETKDGYLVTEPLTDRLNPSTSDYTQNQKEIQAKRIRRLKELEMLGVAVKVGTASWRLDTNWESALRQMEIMRTRSTMLIHHRELMTDPRALPVVTKLKDGEVLLGRSLGGGLDDKDKPYLLIEGADGRAHFISRSDGDDPVKPGKLVMLSGFTSKSGYQGAKVLEYELIIPSRGFAKVMADNPEVNRAVSDMVAAKEKAGLQSDTGLTVGFAGQIARAIQLQREVARVKLDKEKKLIKPVGIE
jgi:hypothetical protein